MTSVKGVAVNTGAAMRSDTIPQPPQRLGALDGLRGLMALWVLLGHACTQTGVSYLPIIRSPHYAVDGFMLMSGFLMTYYYMLRAAKEPWLSPRTWTTFYIRRFFRISPLYYVSLIPAYALYSNFQRWTEAVHQASGALEASVLPPVDFKHMAFHVTYFFGLIPEYHSSLIVPDWSLSLEMQFYLAFPFLMLIVLRFGWLSLATLATAARLWSTSRFGFAHQFLQPSPLPLSLLWFVIGALWANAFLLHSGRYRTWLALAAGALAVVPRDAHDMILIGTFGFILFFESTNPIGVAAARIRAFLSGRVCKFLADASYSVYITHLMILTPVSFLLWRSGRFGTGAKFIIASSITIILAYSVAKPLQALEEGGVEAGRRVSRLLVSQTFDFSKRSRVLAALRGPEWEEHS